MENTIAWYERTRAHWNGIEGLILAELLVLTAYYTILIKFCLDIYTCFLSSIFSEEVIIIIPILLVIIVFLFWCDSRRLPRFSSNEIGLLLSPQMNVNAMIAITKLKRQLILHSKEYGLDIKIKWVPSNIKIVHNKEALRIREKTNALLLIWGIFDENNSKAGFTNIAFTFKRPRTLTLTPFYATEMAIGMLNKKWIYDVDDILGIPTLSSNIMQASLNILGKVLLTYNNFTDSIKILTALKLRYLSTGGNKNNRFLSNFLSSVNKALAFAYHGLGKNVYHSDIFPNIGAELPINSLHRMRAYAKKAIDLDSSNGAHYALRSIANFLMNDISTAKDDCRKSMLKGMTWHGIQYWNMSFIYFYENDFKNGKKYIVKCLKKDVPLNVLKGEIIVFVEKILESNPEKILLLLALGILYKEKIDVFIGAEKLETFIEKATGNSKLNDAIDYARILLDDINNSNI